MFHAQPTSGTCLSVRLSVTLCIPCAFRSAFKSVSQPLSHLHPPNLDNIISYWSTTATDIPYVCLCVRLSELMRGTLCVSENNGNCKFYSFRMSCASIFRRCASILNKGKDAQRTICENVRPSVRPRPSRPSRKLVRASSPKLLVGN